ncbi:enoyl-CoA hydratase-related protein [Salicibibacter cibi]|uniref:enoyl-CoA hydratase-related protein n=1 Tax=Salicibibacter cibi TaxID=2743001 RepID=UPI001FEC4619|nr:enoyl-CoA hydratase-related protein [Salicibibacter cibi]
MTNLKSELLRIREDRAISVVIITGAGNKAFSSGVNVHEFEQLDPQNAREFITLLKEICETLRKMPQAVIAAINGYCIGGAMELAMAADFRIATTHASFGMPEIKLGIPSVLDAALLEKYVGLNLAKEMLLIGDMVDVERINQFGLINQVVDSKDLRHTVDKYADKILLNPPETVAIQKRLFETWQNTHLEMAIQDSINEFSLAFATDIPHKQIADFLADKK